MMLLMDTPSTNGKAFSRAPKFQNGVGFDSGNGLWSTEQGFAIGGQERMSRLNGYISVCRGGVQRVHLLDNTIGGVLLKSKVLFSEIRRCRCIHICRASLRVWFRMWAIE